VILATLVLIGSSATLNEALDALRRGNPSFSRRWLVATLLAGSLFLAIQAYEWWDLIRAGTALAPGPGVPFVSNPWGAATFMQIFFLATGLHGLHVAARECRSLLAFRRLCLDLHRVDPLLPVIPE
jgi:cytochrome c oxidase subunit 3